MKKTLLILLYFAMQNTILAQQKDDKSIVPCPMPSYKKGQTSLQVNEETRIYIECKKNLERLKNPNSNSQENPKKESNTPDNSKKEPPRLPDNSQNTNRPQRNDANKERQHQAREERQRLARERRAEQQRKKRERDGN